MKRKLFLGLLMLCAASALAQISRPQPGSEEYEMLVILQTQYSKQYNNGDLKGASETLLKMSALAPADAHIHILRSTLFVERGNYFPDTAIAEITKAIAIDSTVPEYYFERGKLIWFLPGKDSHAKAANDYHKAVAVDSFFYPAIQKLWIYYFGINNTQKASKYRKLGLRKMQESIKVDSLSAQKWGWLAQAWTDYLSYTSTKVTHDTVVYCYTRAIALAPYNCNYYFERSHYHKYEDGCKKSIADLEKAIELCPSPFYFISMAALYAQRVKDKPKAIEILDQGLLLFPDNERLLDYKRSLLKEIANKK